MRTRLASRLRDNRQLLLFVLLLGVFRTAVADWNPIPSASMHPTLLEGDVVFVNRLAFDLKLPLTDVVLARIGEPRRGDIVTFSQPQDGMRLIKRIAALPGDVVEMRDNRLRVNGQPVDYDAIGEAEEQFGRRALTAERMRETFDGAAHTIQWLPAVRSRANFAARILPSEPRSPKPPGTRMPCTFSSHGAGSSFSKISDSIQSSLTLTWLAKPPCESASISDL